MKRKRSKLSEWQERASKGGICDICGKQTLYLTVDHIVPVSITNMLDETGDACFNMEKNFQMACRPCNLFKGHNLDKKNPLTKEILIELLG